MRALKAPLRPSFPSSTIRGGLECNANAFRVTIKSFFRCVFRRNRDRQGLREHGEIEMPGSERRPAFHVPGLDLHLGFIEGRIRIVSLDQSQREYSHDSIWGPKTCRTSFINREFVFIPQLNKWIDGHEVSWALGAAFHVLQNGV